jgi:hypothetical protein
VCAIAVPIKSLPVASRRFRGVDDYIFVIKEWPRQGGLEIRRQLCRRTWRADRKKSRNDDPERTAMCFRTSFDL